MHAGEQRCSWSPFSISATDAGSLSFVLGGLTSFGVPAGLAPARLRQAWPDLAEREGCSCHAGNQITAESAGQNTRGFVCGM